MELGKLIIADDRRYYNDIDFANRDYVGTAYFFCTTCGKKYEGDNSLRIYSVNAISIPDEINIQCMNGPYCVNWLRRLPTNDRNLVTPGEPIRLDLKQLKLVLGE